MKTYFEARSSVVLRHFFHFKTMAPEDGMVCEESRTVSSRIGLLSLLVLMGWCYTLFTPAWQSTVYSWMSGKMGLHALIILPVASIFVGIAGLFLTKLSSSIAKLVIPFVYLGVLSLIFMGSALQFPVLPYIAMAFLVGCSMIFFDARWSRSEAYIKKYRVHSEKAIIALIPAMTMLFMAYTGRIESIGMIDMFGAVLATGLAYYTHSSFSAMVHFLAYNERYYDRGLWMTTSIIACSILMWPIWLMDANGSLITGAKLVEKK